MSDFYWTESVLTLLFVFGGGLTLGSFIVSRYMSNTLNDIQTDKQDLKQQIIEYEQSYYTEFAELEEKDHTKDFLNNLKNYWTIEDTPVGEIIMTYNSDSESFIYYSERRNVTYRVLDAVARRFAIDNDCKSVCINYKEEFEKGKDTAIKAKQEEQERKNNKNMTFNTDENKLQNNVRKSPYATFKSYNMKKGKTESKKYIITENANRFSYKGMTSQWSNPNDTKIISNKPKINYADFKAGASLDTLQRSHSEHIDNACDPDSANDSGSAGSANASNASNASSNEENISIPSPTFATLLSNIYKKCN